MVFRGHPCLYASSILPIGNYLTAVFANLHKETKPKQNSADEIRSGLASLAEWQKISMDNQKRAAFIPAHTHKYENGFLLLNTALVKKMHVSFMDEMNN